MKAIPHTQPAKWPAKISSGRWAATIRHDSPAGCAIGLLGLPDDRPIALFFGTIRPSKGLEVLLEAWALVGRKLPEALDLVGVRIVIRRGLLALEVRTSLAATAETSATPSTTRFGCIDRMTPPGGGL